MKTVSLIKTPMQKILTVFVIILCITLIPILIANLILIINSVANPNQVPNIFGYKPLIVLSGSMEPTLLTGDLIFVKEVPTESLKVGDVISFREKNLVTTHRVQKIMNEEGLSHFTTKGDNNNIEDILAVTEEMIEGKFLFRILGLGNFIIFIQTLPGMIIFVVLPVTLFILYDILLRRFYERRERKRLGDLEEELARMKEQMKPSVK
ncbi:MAG: signal peptidase I [Eubacteriales bacterium]